MEELLKKYIINKTGIETVSIYSHIIDGAICTVSYYSDGTKSYNNVMNINIWNMLIFLNP